MTHPMTMQEVCDWIAEGQSQTRLDVFGGYPDQWVYRDIGGVPHIIVASIDHDGGPELTVVSQSEYIGENDYYLEDLLEDREVCDEVIAVLKRVDEQRALARAAKA